MSEVKESIETVTITLDGKEVQARKGAMLIEVTDAQNIKVPRFCYHKKLAISANCRMCLVEVEKAPKPMPACATPVMEGMVVHTKSKAAKEAQQSVMEFLLINHPLDCPICDQGGECELQDVAVAYGQSVSQYADVKRVAFDKNIGPLIATDLTRCIHCTRCVRFGREIAGIRELGMTGRGENSLISTFVDECVNSEMSGNSIDVCPVGSLTAKPSRYIGRAWEMIQHKSIAPHDCIGSNVYVHTLRGEVVRVVPRENEAINEVWISDRDRFSYEGVDTHDRLTAPMIKRDGQWQTADWDEALQLVAEKFKSISEQNKVAASSEDSEAENVEPVQQAEMAALVSANSTLEEQYLAQKLLRGLGSGNIDFRLRQCDFSDDELAPVMPWLGQNIEQLEKLDAALLIGSNVRKEQPIANLRLRKAAVNNNAHISFVNPRLYDINFPVAHNIAVAQQDMVSELAAIAGAAFKISGKEAPEYLSELVAPFIKARKKANDPHAAIAKQLADAESSSVILGNIAAMHPEFSTLRTLAEAIASQTNSQFGYLTDGCNAAGGWLAGAVPHRGAGGSTENVVTGKNAAEISKAQLAACLLLNIEPDTDAANANRLMVTLSDANFVAAISSYQSASLKQVADVLLPAANFMETSGTYVNAEGFWQSFSGVVKPEGDSRPAWKILRVLGNLTGVDGFEQMSSEDVKVEVRGLCESIELSNAIVHPVPDTKQSLKASAVIKLAENELVRSSDVPMYASDAIVRRASDLQKTVDAQTLCVRINSAEAERLGINEESSVTVKQGDNTASLTLVIDNSIPDSSAWIPLAVKGNELLGEAFAVVSIEKGASA